MGKDGDEILRSLGRLEGTVGQILDEVKSNAKKLDAHDRRIRDLEKTRGWIKGALAALAVCIGFIFKLASDK